ncbi:MAG: DUF6804 family protein [Luteolibacter sp.]
MENGKQIVPNWVLLAAALFAFVAIADLPYGFYQLLRWVVCAVAVASAIQLHRTNRQGWVWALGGIAVLFNPLMTVGFDKATWRIFDGAAGIAFLAVLYFARKDNVPPRSGDASQSH